jgi:hypothetical protein
VVSRLIIVHSQIPTGAEPLKQAKPEGLLVQNRVPTMLSSTVALMQFSLRKHLLQVLERFLFTIKCMGVRPLDP